MSICSCSSLGSCVGGEHHILIERHKVLSPLSVQLAEPLHLGVQVLADEWIQAARTGRNWRHLKVWMGVSRSTHGGNKAAQA